MDNTNDRLVTNKPEPMKNTDWILLTILVLLLLITFPILFRIYRFFLPIAALGLIVYFIIKFVQLGNIPGNTPEGSTENFTKVWSMFTDVIRKQFRVVMISSIIAVVISVVGILIFNQYSKTGATEKEMSKISQGLEKYKNHHGAYPTGLTELIGNDPLKREWYQDSWGNEMSYTTTKSGGYRLISRGTDGKAGTVDDLILDK